MALHLKILPVIYAKIQAPSPKRFVPIGYLITMQERDFSIMHITSAFIVFIVRKRMFVTRLFYVISNVLLVLHVTNTAKILWKNNATGSHTLLMYVTDAIKAMHAVQSLTNIIMMLFLLTANTGRILQLPVPVSTFQWADFTKSTRSWRRLSFRDSRRIRSLSDTLSLICPSAQCTSTLNLDCLQDEISTWNARQNLSLANATRHRSQTVKSFMADFIVILYCCRQHTSLKWILSSLHVILQNAFWHSFSGMKSCFWHFS